MARNILILGIILEGDFNPNDQEDINFLWDVWYNAEWPEGTRKRFNEALRKLLNGSLPENVVIPKSYQLESIQKVWSAWFSISSKDKAESELLQKKINIER